MLPSKNLQLFLRFLAEFGYSVTALDDVGVMYEVRKGSFLKFLCNTDFNSSECSRLLKDKTLTYRVLKHLGIDIPRGTHFVIGQAQGSCSVEDVVRSLAAAEYPLVLKPNDSLLGKGVTILREYDEARARGAVLRAKKQSPTLLAQEYLSGQEFRIIAVEGEILIAVKKFRRPRPPERASEPEWAGFRDLVARSMKAVGALVCGYDIIAGGGYVKVLEMNSNPTVCPIEEYLPEETVRGYFRRLEALLRRNCGG